LREKDWSKNQIGGIMCGVKRRKVGQSGGKFIKIGSLMVSSGREIEHMF
jgi:hypothetical protein